MSVGHFDLQIDSILSVAEAAGFLPTGRYFQLNSYENRVFDLFMEEAPNIICKVYRPGRWTLEAIKAEHEFLFELNGEGIPAVAPIKVKGDSTIVADNLIYSFFPKARGRMPQELSQQDLRAVGQQLAKLHNIGAQKDAPARPALDIDSMGWDSLDFIEPWVAPEIWPRYEEAACQILEYLQDEIVGQSLIRIHGDCHRGNILQTDPVQGAKQYFFVDFDDFINGMPVQDFWMLFSSDESENQEELNAFLEGYEELRFFDRSTLRLMPAFRGLRIIYYASWIAKRWQDPTFPKLFPEFRNYIYWAEEVEALEKVAWSLGH